MLGLATLTIGSLANADLVTDRATLDSAIAGLAPVTEHFEALAQFSHFTIPPVLSSTPMVYSFGPGLIVPGVVVRDPAMGALSWDGGGYYGLPSGAVLSNDGTLELDFLTPTLGFGVSLLVYEGFGDSATVNVYGPDGQTLLASYSGINIDSPLNPVFFGYDDANGIGKVQISSGYHTSSPIIDDLTFATAIPEPAAPAIAIIGLAFAVREARRKRVPEA